MRKVSKIEQTMAWRRPYHRHEALRGALKKPPRGSGAVTMLWTIFVILLVLWALGMATSYTAGGLIHVLLVVAVVVLIFNLISGRRAI
jgi:hypothetical protein